MLGAGLGLALAGWVLVPMGELLVNSDRQTPLSVADREVGAVGPAAFVSLLGMGGFRSGSTYVASLAIGPIGLLLVLAGFTERQRRPLALLLLAIALAGAAASAAGSPGEWLRSLPPFDRVRYPAKALALTFFALPVLAGLGCDALRFATRAKPGVAAAPGLCGGGRRALAASLFFAAGLFVFAPEEEIRKVPSSLGPLRHMSGRVLTPPMRDVAFWALQSGRFDTGTLRRQREALLGYTNLLFDVPTVRTAAALPTLAAREIADSIDASAGFVQPAGAAGVRVLVTMFPPPEMGSRKAGEISERRSTRIGRGSRTSRRIASSPTRHAPGLRWRKGRRTSPARCCSSTRRRPVSRLPRRRGRRSWRASRKTGPKTSSPRCPRIPPDC